MQNYKKQYDKMKLNTTIFFYIFLHIKNIKLLKNATQRYIVVKYNTTIIQ